MERVGHKPGSVILAAVQPRRQLSIWDACYQTPQAGYLRNRKKTNRGSFLAPNRGLPSQHLSMLLVRS